jgi:hypothetical protein
MHPGVFWRVKSGQRLLYYNKYYKIQDTISTQLDRCLSARSKKNWSSVWGGRPPLSPLTLDPPLTELALILKSQAVVSEVVPCGKKISNTPDVAHTKKSSKSFIWQLVPVESSLVHVVSKAMS